MRAPSPPAVRLAVRLSRHGPSDRGADALAFDHPGYLMTFDRGSPLAALAGAEAGHLHLVEA